MFFYLYPSLPDAKVPAMRKSESQRPRFKPTSIPLPERTHRLAKTVASVRGLSLSAFLVQVVQEHLDKPKVRAEIARALKGALALPAKGR